MSSVDANGPEGETWGNAGTQGEGASRGASAPATALRRLREQLEREKDDAIINYGQAHVQQIMSMAASHRRQVTQLQQ